MAKAKKVARKPLGVSAKTLRNAYSRINATVKRMPAVKRMPVEPDSPLAAKRDVFIIRVMAQLSRNAEDLLADLTVPGYALNIALCGAGIRVLSVSKENQP
jgi:hypothetical protein